MEILILCNKTSGPGGMPFILASLGFGFNTNILETNIINLSVVLAIVFSFVGNSLRSILENRKQTIFKNLGEADRRENEAKEKVKEAQSRLNLAQKERIEIKEQGLSGAEEEKKESFRETEKEIDRLEVFKVEKFNLKKQKVMFQIAKRVISLALEKVRKKFKKPLSKKNQVSVNNFHTVRLTNYKPKY